jgi:hypothetical protein
MVGQAENSAAPAPPEPTTDRNVGNRAHQMIARHHLLEIERIEQLPLIPAHLPHHRPSSPIRIGTTESLFHPRFKFRNKIGQKPAILILARSVSGATWGCDRLNQGSL